MPSTSGVAEAATRSLGMCTVNPPYLEVQCIVLPGMRPWQHRFLSAGARGGMAALHGDNQVWVQDRLRLVVGLETACAGLTAPQHITERRAQMPGHHAVDGEAISGDPFVVAHRGGH